MKRLITALLLSGTATSAVAQTAIMPVALTTPEAGANTAVSTLVRQAERWLAQSRSDLALLSINRALSAEPSNSEALLVAARIETARNNREAALALLRRAAAGGTADQRQVADAAQRSLSLDQVALDQARRLAREGRLDEASSRYRALFGAAGPAPEYAREYYQALAGSAGSRAEGITGLSRLAEAPNADATTRLASATALTYQEATRADGIAQLRTLTNRPETAAAAQQSWRQALGFLGNDPAAAPQIQAYLARFPNDAELSQRLEAIRRAPAAPVADTKQDNLRREGFAQLDSGSLRQSSERFTAALAANPADADALGGLGLVRLRDNKPEEARPLLERAIAADPSRAAQWQKALDGAAYGAALSTARTALRRGDPATADTVLRDAMRRDVPDQTDAESLLGEVSLAQGDAAGAEQRFRRALARRPGFPPATTGLNQALRAQGRNAEPPPRSAATPDTAPTPARTDDRAGQLQAEAAQTTDATIAVTLLRSAIALAPLNPWPRLDLARALKRQGRGPEGRALVEELAAQSNTADAHFAAALLAQEDSRLEDADTQLGAISRRTPDMSRLQARIRTERDIARAAMGGNLDAGSRQALMAIATRPDPSGTIGAAVIRAFGTAGDRRSAVEASRVALAANAGAGPAARLAIAGALLGADADTDASAIADQLKATTLTGDQRRDLASLRAGIAIRASDRLNESGAQAQAFERLRPVIAQDPENPDGQLALARLYQGARQPAEALALAQSVLARDPRNFAARQGAVDAAIALGDRRTAQTLVAEAQAIGPNDSRLTYLQARVASSFGNTTRAQALLQQSLEQRQAELGTDPSPSGGAHASDLSNPFLRGTKLAAISSATPTDPLSRQILRDLKSSETSNAPQVSFAPTLHTRSGSPGLDQLAALGATIEGQIATPGIGGRMVVRADPVLLNSGQIGSTLTTLQRFGTNPVLGNGAVTPKNVSTSGVGLAVGYNLRDVFKLSAGTTPLGFKTAGLIGAIEVAPRITDTLRLRITGDRHAMTDSLLSWAGLTDPSSRITWGSVTSSGGRGQIEGPMGAGSFYAGGGYSILTGQHVASNNRTEAGTGFSYPLLKDPDGELTAGVDLVYFGFANNQRAYTVGNGGYFSPQSYGAINVPLDYRGKSGDLDYRVGVTAGYATFRESSNAVFPNNPDLQRQLERAASSNALLITRTPALTRNGFIGGVRVDLAYQLTPTLSLAGSLRYDQAPQFDETNVMVKLLSKF